MSNNFTIVRNELLKINELKIFDRGENDFLFSTNKIWFAYSRQALAFGLNILGIREGDSVLVPEYICNVIEAPFYENKIQIKYYRILEDLSPDFDNIKSILDRSVKALLYVNYFGFPAHFKDIKAFCDKHNFFTIEDNAHGFLSKSNETWLGRYGDISVTSVYKKLPLIHGTYLQINFTSEKYRKPNYNLNVSFSTYLLRYLKRYLYRNISNKVTYNNLVLNNSDCEIPDPKMQIKISKSVQFIVKRLNIKNFHAYRMNKYKKVIDFLTKELKNDGRLLYPEINNEVLPLQLPFLLEGEIDKRNSLIKRLRESGVELFYWPDLPGRIINNQGEFKLANYYKNNCIHFPIC